MGAPIVGWVASNFQADAAHSMGAASLDAAVPGVICLRTEWTRSLSSWPQESDDDRPIPGLADVSGCGLRCL